MKTELIETPIAAPVEVVRATTARLRDRTGAPPDRYRRS